MKKIRSLFGRRYPQNFIIKSPLFGAFIMFIFCFAFLYLYEPLNVKSSTGFNFVQTMAIYCLIVAGSVFAIVKLFKLVNFFANPLKWTFFKEVVAVITILFGLGIVIYFVGFLMEPPVGRWNFSTFLSSCKGGFLIGVLPLGLFTIINFKNLDSKVKGAKIEEKSEREELIEIKSKLKKEELSFYSSQFLFAESEGNYVAFYLNIEGQITKKIIRNSISQIEIQLASFSYIIRTHRAFIVNLNKVIGKKGNSLGYKLSLADVPNEIPVSRQKTKLFDQSFIKFK